MYYSQDTLRHCAITQANFDLLCKGGRAMSSIVAPTKSVPCANFCTLYPKLSLKPDSGGCTARYRSMPACIWVHVSGTGTAVHGLASHCGTRSRLGADVYCVAQFVRRVTLRSELLYGTPFACSKAYSPDDLKPQKAGSSSSSTNST